MEEHYIGTIGLGSFWVRDSRQFQLIGFAHGFQLITATIRRNSLQRSWLIGHIIEGKKIAVTLCALTYTFTIQEQFDLIACRHHVYWFPHPSFGGAGGGLIVPMPDDVGLRFFRLYPTIPHHLMGIEGIFGDTHSIDHTAGAIVLLATMMGIGIGKDNLHTT